MTRLTFLALLAAGCSSTDSAIDDDVLVEGERAWFDAPPADGMAPPPLPQQMTLSHDPLVPGDTSFVSVTGATSGDIITFLRGNAGGTTCPPPLGGDCLDLGSPKILGTATANALGEAVLAISIPLTVPVGAVMNMQAMANVAAPYASNVVSDTTVSVCGDSLQQSNEDCDDGNALPDDGCSDLCLAEFCGDGVQQSSEQCDDGNTTPGDGCDDLCFDELTDDFELFVERATLTNNNPANGQDWDFDPFGIFDKPDPYFEVWVDTSLVYASSTAQDTRFPVWFDTFPVTVVAGETLYVDVWDEDVVGSEYAGTIELSHDDLNAWIDMGGIVGTHFGVQSLEFEISTP